MTKQNTNNPDKNTFIRLNDVLRLFKNRKKFGIKRVTREKIMETLRNDMPFYVSRINLNTNHSQAGVNMHNSTAVEKVEMVKHSPDTNSNNKPEPKIQFIKNDMVSLMEIAKKLDNHKPQETPLKEQGSKSSKEMLSSGSPKGDNSSSQICECGHEKKYHSGKSVFCKFIDDTENWDIPKEIKEKYLKLGIKELAVCPCPHFRPKTGQEEI